MFTGLTYIPAFFLQPVRLFLTYNRRSLRPDLLAGLTTAIVSLPQAIVFAQIAGLPPEMGLYTSIISGAIAALWGCSKQLLTGPTNVISLLVLSVLLTVATPGSPDFIIVAGLLAVMVGLLQLVIGLTRLGVLVNFVSHAVIVGFTAGAGILIITQQLPYLLGLEVASRGLLATIQDVLIHLSDTHWPTLVLGLSAIVFMVLFRWLNPKLPDAFISMIIVSIFVFALSLDKNGVKVVGQLAAGLPPLGEIPLFDFKLIGRLSAGALAVAAIGLVQTAVIIRSIAMQTGQRLQINQEFVGQGLGNIASGLFSGYPSCGSISGSVLNFKLGARTPLSAIFSSVFMLIGMFILAPLTVYLPLTALAGILIVAGYNMINRVEMSRLWRGARDDALIMLATFLGTVFLQVQFAVLLGILLSFARYIMKTSIPRVYPVSPDRTFEHFIRQQHGQPSCPQLGILQISGDLYFGAVWHIEEAISDYLTSHPEQRFLLLRMHSVNQCDLQGIYMLQAVAQRCQARRGGLYLMRVREPVLEFMKTAGFYDELGPAHFLTGDYIIGQLFRHALDPVICIYECPVRVFKECQNLPKQVYLADLPLPSYCSAMPISSEELRLALDNGHRPLVIDVREPREFKHGHIPQADLMPLSKMRWQLPALPPDRDLVLVCRSGWRSAQAAYLLQSKGYQNVRVLCGGMIAWQTAGFEEVEE